MHCRPRLRIKPIPVYLSKLPHKRHDRGICERWHRTEQLTRMCKPRLQIPQRTRPGSPMYQWLSYLVTLRVFIAIEVMLERAVVLAD